MDRLFTLPRQLLKNSPARRIGQSAENVIGIHGCHGQTITKQLWFVNRMFSSGIPRACPRRSSIILATAHSLNGLRHRRRTWASTGRSPKKGAHILRNSSQRTNVQLGKTLWSNSGPANFANDINHGALPVISWQIVRGEASSFRRQNGSFDWTWVLSKDGLGREMLATALAAVVSGKFIEAQIEEPVGPWSRVDRLVIVK